MRRTCALIDMDGTIYDSGIDFLSVRRQLGLPQDGVPILEQLKSAPSKRREHGLALLHAAEAQGAANGRLIPKTLELLDWLAEKHIARVLITNNSRKSVDTVLATYPLSFELILTREDGIAKPDPHLFLLALESLGLSASDAVAIGDTHLDALAAYQAGVREIELVHLSDWMVDLIPHEVSYRRAADLTEVMRMIDAWLVLREQAEPQP